MKFSEMLNDFETKHHIEQVMLVTNFSCGCIFTLTFAHSTILSDLKGVRLFHTVWSSNANCTVGHEEMDLSEVKDIKDKVNLAIEIKLANSIKVSLEEHEKQKVV